MATSLPHPAWRKRIPWALWAVLILILGSVLARWLYGSDKRVFLPGETTVGHHQIEMKCDACHSPGGGVRNDACFKCHGDAMQKAHDSHPEKKFTDPRNADLLSSLDARACATCHQEHREQWVHPMGLTLPPDYCARCHQDIAKDRPSHQGMGFETCATAGCHNFHDNSGIYEDFLAQHLQEPAMLPRRDVPVRFISEWMKTRGETIRALTAENADAPPTPPTDPHILSEWQNDAHALAGVNCTDCHGKTWQAKPTGESCRRCHENETRGFLQGRHGMRLDVGLSPMKVEWAKIPMKADAAHRELTCISCHGAHEFDTKKAAVEACLQCHDDAHTRDYPDSPHHRAWVAEMSGRDSAGTGVSCATCHMPRRMNGKDSSGWTWVEHNQNATLRPNEKMLRPVCLNCHGMEFSLDALADSALIHNNFRGRPHRHVESLDMVLKRVRDYAEAREKNL